MFEFEFKTKAERENDEWWDRTSRSNKLIWLFGVLALILLFANLNFLLKDVEKEHTEKIDRFCKGLPGNSQQDYDTCVDYAREIFYPEPVEDDFNG